MPSGISHKKIVVKEGKYHDLQYKRKLILPTDEHLQYMGRIDDADKNAPVLVYPYTMIKTKFTGTKAAIKLCNHRGCWDNYLGVIVDGVQTKVLLPHGDEEVCLTLAKDLENGWHDLTVF